jgi:3',5'-cyclic AMP phosphodiesterase CpdA
MRLAHISDLHVSSHYFVKEWADKVIDMVNNSEVDLVVITGDLTMDGHPHEYDMVDEVIDRIVPEKFIVPGNHDAMNGGYEIFEEKYGTRKPYFENDEVAIVGMDSSEPDIHDGQIGRHNYPTIRDKLTIDKVTILALHHHIIPIPKTGREWNILMDAGDVLSLCVDIRLDMVLSGHRHLPWVWELQDTYFVTAGTACTRRLKGRSFPSFNMIDIIDKRITLDQINVLTGEKKRLMDKERNDRPIRQNIGNH